eukprot:CAMPEP_0204633304 /NCGR_PEP_ID=MMETSP0717-20131115/26866_1 /ASSEMBLY_ACC=CAM_ASM_000666 /TAXON_ID=230516 /ORGANISM="Chaetoceros curvisetus" /LENGTH=84 /DNA_ID=CAMNT_0051651427 /DNA_START=170 /DNA_END=424 /DNA_ORIENTATION=-
MQIFNDGNLQETITLSDYKTQDDMHQLFRDKGFEQISEDPFERKREMQRKKKDYKETIEKERQKREAENDIKMDRMSGERKEEL